MLPALLAIDSPYETTSKAPVKCPLLEVTLAIVSLYSNKTTKTEVLLLLKQKLEPGAGGLLGPFLSKLPQAPRSHGEKKNVWPSIWCQTAFFTFPQDETTVCHIQRNKLNIH